MNTRSPRRSWSWRRLASNPLVFWGALLAVGLAVAGLESHRSYRAHLDALLHETAQSARQADLVLQRLTEHAATIGIAAESYFQAGHNHRSKGLSSLRYDAERDRFLAPGAAPRPRFDFSLSGIGDFRNRGADFDTELDMALSLTPYFRLTRQSHPELEGVYYASAAGFIVHYPSVAPETHEFHWETLERPFFRAAAPQQNPQRAPRWSRAYADKAGAGGLVTLATPVYDADRFRGVIGVDITLRELAATLGAAFSGCCGELRLADGATLLAGVSLPPAPEAEVFHAAVGALANRPPRRLHDSGGRKWAHFPLTHAPWALWIGITPKSVVKQVLLDIRPSLLLLALLMLLLWVSRYRQLAMRKLSRSHRRYEQLFSRNQAVELLIDPADGRILDANLAAERFYGWSREQLKRLRIGDINTLTPAEVSAEMQRAKAEKRNHFIFQHRLANGLVRDVEVHSGPVDLESRTILYSIIHDISDRRDMERRLQSAERRYRSLFEHSNDGLLLFRAGAWELLDANRRACEMLGYAPDQLTGRSFLELHPADERAALTAQLQGVESATGVLFETRQLTPGGSRMVEVSARLLELNDTPVILAIVRDIEARKQAEAALCESEQRYRDLVNNAAEIIAIIDGDRIRYLNPAGVALSGFDPQLEGECRFSSLLHPADRQHHVLNRLGAEDAAPQTATHGVLRLIDRAGHSRWVQSKAVAVNWENRPVTLMFMADITRVLESERALHALVEGTAKDVGQPFFHSLVQHLAQALAVRYAFVGRLLPEGERVRTIALWANGEQAENFEYDLAGTPCETVMAKVPCAYSDRITERFPEDQLLQQMGAESYIAAPLFDSQGRPLGLLAVLDDQPMGDTDSAASVLAVFASRAGAELEREQAEVRLRQAAAVFESNSEAIVITDAEARILAVNRAFTEITGYSEAEVLGRNPNLLHSGLQDPGFYRAMWEQLLREGQWRGELSNRRKNGKTYPAWMTINSVPDAHGEVRYYVGVAADLSNLKQFQQALQHLEHHDPLTDLPNQRLFNQHLAHSITRARRDQEKAAVLVLDLDHFKHINESLGHQLGDELLIEVSRRFRGQLREGDTLARQGGDEFMVLLEDLQRAEEASLVAGKLLATLKTPFELHGERLFLAASLGICIFPDDAATAGELISGADAAMYRAKERGRDNFQYFSVEQSAQALERLQLENQLREALQNDELRLFYQPQVCLISGRIVGAEALIRWQSPERGLVFPDRFIPLAEENGLIHPLGEWVLSEACRQLAAWDAAGLHLPKLAVNLSAKQLEHKDLATRVNAIVRHAQMAPERLELEITESAVMRRPDDAVAQLKAIHRTGIGLALDDFGTGYSALGYLKRLPVQKIKIDRSFVQDLPHDEEDVTITRTVIAMGQALGLTVIAEGVEEIIQRDFLAEQGCDLYQGYLCSRPVNAAAFGRLLAQARCQIKES